MEVNMKTYNFIASYISGTIFAENEDDAYEILSSYVIDPDLFRLEEEEEEEEN